MQIGSVGNGITLDASGNATFNGEITIGASLAASISGSIAGQTGSLDSAISTAQSTANTGVSNAATAQSTANSAQSPANTANTAADRRIRAAQVSWASYGVHGEFLEPALLCINEHFPTIC